MIRNLLAFVVLAAVLIAPVAAYAQQKPTLGELARKEEERRKALKAAPTKVLTNKDLPRTPSPASPAAGEASPAAGEAPQPEVEQTPEKPEDPARGEAWWRQRMSQAREELRRNEMFAEALQTRINALTNDFSSRDDPAQRAQISEERSKAIVEMERVKADIEAVRKKIADIEEEARRAGVPPGWLR